MSLILSRASKDYVLQVSGRLFPQNILYCAANGIAALGYAGFDSIDGIPTSQWLAETLAGYRFPRDRQPADYAVPRRAAYDLGQALRTLAHALSHASVELASSFDLHIVGWQWTRNRWRPIVAGLSKDPGSPVFQIEYLPRYWYLDRGKPASDGHRGYRFNVSAAPDTRITRPQLQSIVRWLRDLTPDEAENVLRGALHEIAKTVPEAGPHCLSILLEPPSAARARVRHFSGIPHAGARPSQNGGMHVPAAFPPLPGLSPWLLAPGRITVPAAMSGKTVVRLGPYEVSLENLG